MSLRFRRSIRLAPGLRLNLGKRGMSLSAGVRGAGVTLGSRGVWGNVGVPGTGVSVRERLDAPAARKSPRALGSRTGRSAVAPAGTATAAEAGATAAGELLVRLSVGDDGKVILADSEGNALPPRVVRVLRQEREPEIRAWLAEQCERWNQGIDEILTIHLATPDPARRPDFHPRSFSEPRPEAPARRDEDFLAKLFRGRREDVEEENRRAAEAHAGAVAAWEERRDAHEAAEARRRESFSRSNVGDPAAMEARLREALAAIQWPRETLASFDFSPDGSAVALDVDLPEIEDLPAEEARVAARGLRIVVKRRSDADRRRAYATHVHAIAFRVIGETFAALAAAAEVTFSGYSQRPDSATGQVEEQYLLSVRVSREGWSRLNFADPSRIDLAECLAAFELRRSMTRTGTFTPIEPLAVS